MTCGIDPELKSGEAPTLAMDPPSADWLGHHADRPAIRTSGLWNVRHIERHPTAEGLDRFAALIAAADGV